MATAAAAAPAPTYTLPPGTSPLPAEVSVRSLCLSFLNDRCRISDFDNADLLCIADVRITASTGSHRGRQGTWCIFQVTRNTFLEDKGLQFTAFKPPGEYAEEIPPRHRPANLHPNRGRHWDVELYQQEESISDLYTDGVAGDKCTYFVRWKRAKSELWKAAQLFTSEGAFSIILELLRNQHDLVPLSEPLEPSEEPTSFRIWRWADIVRTEYFLTTAGSKLSPVMFNVLQAGHERDRTIIGSLQRVYVQSRLQWKEARNLLGNPPSPTYPDVIHKQRVMRFRLHVLTRDSEDGTEDRGGLQRAILYEDLDEGRWYVIKPPVTLEQHAARHLKIIKQTPEEQEWVFHKLAIVGEESVQFMVCKDTEQDIHGKVVVKQLGYNPREEACDPVELVVEPREVYLHKKLKRLVGNTNSLTELESTSYHHSERHLPWKLYIEYAPYKTLDDVFVDNCWEDYSTGDGASSYLPEVFLWHVFWHLTNACCTLRDKGRLGHEYVHIDINPANVFIKEGEPHRWPAYKVPALGDFGLYKILDCNNLDSQDGTPGFRAPEQFPPYPSTALRTDIFQIGLTIWALMRGLRGGLRIENQPDHQELEDIIKEVDRDVGYDDLYSVQLEELVAHCLKRNPAQRIDHFDLRLEVQQGRTAHSAQIGGATYWDCAEENIHQWYRVRFREHEFSLGQQSDNKKRRSPNSTDTPNAGALESSPPNAGTADSSSGLQALAAEALNHMPPMSESSHDSLYANP